jgi:hypothetical protein
MDLLSSVTNWEFLDEPLYRWAIFLVALSFIAFAWNGSLRILKEFAS